MRESPRAHDSGRDDLLMTDTDDGLVPTYIHCANHSPSYCEQQLRWLRWLGTRRRAPVPVRNRQATATIINHVVGADETRTEFLALVRERWRLRHILPRGARCRGGRPNRRSCSSFGVLKVVRRPLFDYAASRCAQHRSRTHGADLSTRKRHQRPRRSGADLAHR